MLTDRQYEFWAIFSYYLLDLTPDAAHSPDGRAFELGDLEIGIEHALDKGRLLEDLTRGTDELDLFHNARGVVELQHDCSSSDPKCRLHASTECPTKTSSDEQVVNPRD